MGENQKESKSPKREVHLDVATGSDTTGVGKIDPTPLPKVRAVRITNRTGQAVPVELNPYRGTEPLPYVVPARSYLVLNPAPDNLGPDFDAKKRAGILTSEVLS